MFTLILVIIAAAISYLPTSMSAIVLLQGLDNVRSASAFARFIVKVRPPSLDSNPRPTCSPHQRALTYLLERTIYEGDRIDHGHRERDYPDDDGPDSAAVHRNVDVLLPTSHSCSKLHRKTEGMPTEGPDNLANRRDDKFTDQRRRERASKGERGGREELLALPTAGEEGGSRVCAMPVSRDVSHNTDKTRDKR